jgi:hypothetical protein
LRAASIALGIGGRRLGGRLAAADLPVAAGRARERDDRHDRTDGRDDEDEGPEGVLHDPMIAPATRRRSSTVARKLFSFRASSATLPGIAVD